jgi:hypothetical protein
MGGVVRVVVPELPVTSSPPALRAIKGAAASVRYRTDVCRRNAQTAIDPFTVVGPIRRLAAKPRGDRP